MNERDPYSLVYDEMWHMVEASPEFARLVPLHNRVKFSGANANPIKDEVSSSDLPEVRLIARSGNPRQAASSSTMFKRLRFEWQISSGDQRFDALVFPIQWAIDLAVQQWQADQRWRQLEWQGHAFVIHAVQRADFAYSASEQIDQLRGVRGWSTTNQIEVEMGFPSALLKGL